MKNQKSKRFAALDAVLIVLILTAVVLCGIRIVLAEDGLFPQDTEIKGSFSVSFRPEDIAESDFEKDLRTGIYVYLSSGEIMGQITDIEPDLATVSVAGTMTDSGFLLNDTFYLAPNMSLEIRSLDKTVTVTVTDITFLN